VLDNPEINTVLIATRHDSHADLTARALAAGKAVLVEKPLALNMDEINQVIEARNAVDGDSGAFFQIGFNRRFAPMSAKIRDGLAESQGPALVLVRVNAGAIPGDHWVHSADEGGGRILGEVCHFVDLARYLIGAATISVQADAAKPVNGACDDVTISMRFANGSLATIFYTAQGDTAAGKERIEAYGGGKSYAIDDFRHFTTSAGARQTSSSSTQDKGFRNALAAFTHAAANGGPAPVDEAELIETSVATIAVMESLRSGERVDL
jgi:predicted dehydrogenase